MSACCCEHGRFLDEHCSRCNAEVSDATKDLRAKLAATEKDLKSMASAVAQLEAESKPDYWAKTMRDAKDREAFIEEWVKESLREEGYRSAIEAAAKHAEGFSRVQGDADDDLSKTIRTIAERIAHSIRALVRHG